MKTLASFDRSLLRGSTLIIRSLLLALLCFYPSAAQLPAEATLTNNSVVKLVKAGFKEKTIISIIHSRPNNFKLDTEELIQLKHSGVSENVILAMLSQDESFVVAEDDWASDSFFRRGDRRSSEVDPNEPGAGTNIFGSSSGGSRSQSDSRTGNGGSQNDGNITGSATVRILRPPTEAGGGPPKLERVPTLNNDGVVKLVEAGFSEGTIIKRIEDSPVDFDLSPAKLDELRKRRVTDAIIAAMSTAMGGQS